MTRVYPTAAFFSYNVRKKNAGKRQRKGVDIMIEAIVGHKGSGKTARIVQEITEAAQHPDNNIVCIEYGKRFDRNLPYMVRLIDIQEYPVHGYGELLSFIAGINAKDYDITHIYIDSIYKVAGVDDPASLAEFTRELNDFFAARKVKVVLTISEDPENIPEDVKANIIEH